MRLAPLLSLAPLALLLAAGPARAQVVAQAGGFPGSTIGIPADPFASNYPSAPPPREVVPQPGYEGRPRTVRRPVRRGARPLRPPADVPYR